MIELKNVSYVYDEKTGDEIKALSNVDFKIEDGEAWALIGHTGSGKSTLSEIISGLIKPTEGEVLVDGESIVKMKNPTGWLKGRVGMVFQYPENQLFEESVIKDIAFGPKNMGLSETDAYAAAREAMAMVKLGYEYDNLSPFELSGGEKRRVAIAGILAMHPDVLILDEPTAGLDPSGRDALLATLGKIKGNLCKSIVLVSHSMEDVALYADKILVMNKGRVFLKGDVKKVFSEREKLLEAGLDVPQVTRLMSRLCEKGHRFDDVIITVDEAVDAIMEKLQNVERYNDRAVL